jgi:hypothetical protein
MYAVVRTFSGPGAKALFDLLEIRKGEVDVAMRSVPGLVSYTLLRSGDGGVSVTVCHDKKGTDASVQVAREWVQQNLSGFGWPPIVEEGAVLIHI